MFSFSALQILLGAFSGLIIGLSKTGISGLSILFVPLMAASFGAKLSTGIILPMLIVGDIFAVTYYRREADWKKLLQLLPWALVGLLAGVTVGAGMPDAEFKKILAAIVFALLLLMLWQDTRKKTLNYPNSWWFCAAAGLLAGFTTMVGNAAGPVMIIYLLSMRLPKSVFIGTSAWFFFIINLCKVPLQIFFWKNISLSSLSFDLLTLPAIAAGAFLGIKIVGKFPEKVFRILIFIMTAISGIFLLF